MGMKRGKIALDALGWWIIGAVVLVVGILIVIVLKGKGAGAVEYVKNLLRFGGGTA